MGGKTRKSRSQTRASAERRKADCDNETTCDTPQALAWNQPSLTTIGLARTPCFAGADLANVVNEAALLAARRDHVAVLRTDFEEAIERVVAGLEKKNRRISEREKEIVLAKVPGVTANLADQIARVVRSIRQLDLKKAPSVSETLDWARTLLLLNIDTIDEKTAKETLHILLKYQTDIAKATKELSVETK